MQFCFLHEVDVYKLQQIYWFLIFALIQYQSFDVSLIKGDALFLCTEFDYFDDFDDFDDFDEFDDLYDLIDYIIKGDAFLIAYELDTYKSRFVYCFLIFTLM